MALNLPGITDVEDVVEPQVPVIPANTAVRTSIHGVVLKSFWLKGIVTSMAMEMEKRVNHSANPNRACGVLDDQDAAAGLRDRLELISPNAGTRLEGALLELGQVPLQVSRA